MILKIDKILLLLFEQIVSTGSLIFIQIIFETQRSRALSRLLNEKDVF